MFIFREANEKGIFINMLQPTTKTWEQAEDSNPGSALKYAHEYLDRGFAPAPVIFKGKACRVTDWPNLRLDHEGIDREFREPCNVGIILGQPSGGIVDIDLDCPESIALAPHMLPPTGMIFGRDSKPASHRIYRVPNPGKKLEFIDPDRGMLVELRAEGCMTVFPGSVHKSGEIVGFDEDGDPAEIDFDQLASSVRHLAAASLLLSHWEKGKRHRLALALAGTLLAGEISAQDVYRFFDALIAAKGDREGEDRYGCIDSTVRRLENGEAVSGRKELAAIIGDSATKRFCEWLSLTGSSLRRQAQGSIALQTFGGPAAQSDVANAERFKANHSGRAIYCAELKRWFVWDGARWAADEGGHVMRLAIATGREIALEAAERGDKESLSWAAKVNDLPRLRNMVALAQSYCETNLDAFDADLRMLNCQSGIIDLETGELLPHDPEALIRRLAPVDFDPKAECPIFLAFLEHIFEGDEELIGFLQRAIGYSLTGDTGEQCLFVLIGSGANGKSTLIGVLQELLGDYAQQTPMETFMVTRSGSIPNDIARLEGTRLVTATEAEAGQRLAEAKIKQLTGGDRIAARFLHKEFFEFIPRCKFWLATNHLPEVKGTDHAIWRRIHLIPFNVRIAEADQDRSLSEKLRAELPGILNWAIAGCLGYQRSGGLRPPAKVTDTTKAYRTEMDVVAQFIDDCCVVDRQAEETVKELYAAYGRWCEANGEQAISKRAFGQRLQELGFEKARSGVARVRGGVRLKTDRELLKALAFEDASVPANDVGDAGDRLRVMTAD